MTAGAFIEPDPSLETADDPSTVLGVPIYSGYQTINQLRAFAGANRIFDHILERAATLDIRCEDQCSPQYYADLFQVLRDYNGEFTRVVEVGVYLGGASVILGGCAEAFNFDIDMVDVNADFLRFAYERLRRAFPEAAKRVRLFHGDLPSYVRKVLMPESGGRNIIHHDGSHRFDEVVRDLAALSFVQDKLHAVIAQDTHLRGSFEHLNFVDLALYAVFGTDLKYLSIGAAYDASDARTLPNAFQGNYFMPGAYEGLVVPMAANSFRYPHPSMGPEGFLPPED